MDDFHENIVFLLDHLGVVDFSAITEDDKIDYENVFEIRLTMDRINKEGEVLTGKMVITDAGFRLLEGSYIETKARDSFSKHSYYPLRIKLEKEGFFEPSEIEGCWKLKADLDFSSPSAAATIVKNRATNGKTEWKLNDGKTLAEYMTQE